MSLANTSAYKFLRTQGLYFAKQSEDEKQRKCTHTFMNGGGVAILDTASHYIQLIQAVAEDVCTADGAVPICENFPYVGGEYPDTLPPPAPLVLRAAEALEEKLPDSVQRQIEEWAKQNQKSKEKTKGQRWDKCRFALDLDYGEAKFCLRDVLEDVRVIQQTLRIYGLGDDDMCAIILANTNNVHLYFYLTNLFPEQCMQLARAAWTALLKQKRPTRSDRSWEKIVDGEVYKGSIRVAGVQKCADCPCSANSAKRRKPDPENMDADGAEEKKGRTPAKKKRRGAGCDACAGSPGKIFGGRQYWFAGSVDAQGKIDEEHNELLLPTMTQLQMTARERLRRGVVLDPTALSKMAVLLRLTSLRLSPENAENGRFRRPPGAPRAELPRNWCAFFASVLRAARRYNSVVACDLDSIQKPWSSPMGHSLAALQDLIRANFKSSPLSPAPAPQQSVEKEKQDKDAFMVRKSALGRGKREKLRESEEVPAKYRDLFPDECVESRIARSPGLLRALFAEFEAAHVVRRQGDRHSRCDSLEELVRAQRKEWAELLVTKVIVAQKTGCVQFNVTGTGQRFCLIAGREHKKQQIYFRISPTTYDLTQCCFDPDCRQPRLVCNVSKNPELIARLFPNIVVERKIAQNLGAFNEDQVKLASQLSKEYCLVVKYQTTVTDRSASVAAAAEAADGQVVEATSSRKRSLSASAQRRRERVRQEKMSALAQQLSHAAHSNSR